jgi:hypothetical protein
MACLSGWSLSLGCQLYTLSFSLAAALAVEDSIASLPATLHTIIFGYCCNGIVSMTAGGLVSIDSTVLRTKRYFNPVFQPWVVVRSKFVKNILRTEYSVPGILRIDFRLVWNLLVFTNILLPAIKSTPAKVDIVSL